MSIAAGFLRRRFLVHSFIEYDRKQNFFGWPEQAWLSLFTRLFISLCIVEEEVIAKRAFDGWGRREKGVLTYSLTYHRLTAQTERERSKNDWVLSALTQNPNSSFIPYAWYWDIFLNELPLFLGMESFPVGVEIRSNWDNFMSEAMFTPRPDVHWYTTSSSL